MCGEGGEGYRHREQQGGEPIVGVEGGAGGKSGGRRRRHWRSRWRPYVARGIDNGASCRHQCGLGIPQVVKVPQGAPVGKDVEEAQELPVNPTRGRHDTGQEGISGAQPVGIGLAIPCHLGALRGLEELVDIGVEQLPVVAHVREVVAAELLGAGNVDDKMPIATNVGILDEEVAATRLVVGLQHLGNVVAMYGQA